MPDGRGHEQIAIRADHAGPGAPAIAAVGTTLVVLLEVSASCSAASSAAPIRPQPSAPSGMCTVSTAKN